jgi:3-oxoacyl-[acyl-carrier-protein] synthase II
MAVLITGIGWVNGAGAGQGRERPFRFLQAEGPIQIPTGEVLSFPLLRFGRMDTYSRLGVAAIGLALKDAGLLEWSDVREISVVASTVYGCLETDEAYYETVLPQGGKLASPHLFSHTLSNTFLGEGAIQFGLSGAAFVLHEPALKGTGALHLAFLAVGQGERPAALAGVCDSGPRPHLGLAGRTRAGALFFVLQQEGKNVRPPYGSLTRERDRLYFNGEEILDLFRLAETCATNNG